MEHQKLLATRIASQGLHGTEMSVRTVLERMAAMQAQDYYGGLWSIGVRSGQTQASIVESLERREIIRTWPQRGTLHWVLSEDARWMTSLSGPRLLKAAVRRHENLGLDHATLERSKELFGQALETERELTRPEMMAVLESAGITTQGGRGYHLLWHAAQTGQIYIGPMRNKQQTFGLLDALPVKQRFLDPDEAVAELARRYFTSRGPATLQDFMWWSGLTSKQAKAGLEAARGLLESATIDGREYWFGAVNSDTIPTALLLAGFDEYVLGYKDRSAQLRAEHMSRIVPGSNGMFMPTIVLDGQVAGIWKRSLKGGTQPRAEVTIEYFGKVSSDARKAAAATLAPYAHFLGLPLELL